MTRISTNVLAINTYQHLMSTQKQLAVSLERLSSGYKINRASDDPSGMVQSTYLDADIAATDQAIENLTRSSNMLSTADGTLQEIGNLLLGIRDQALLAANSGTLTSEELDTAQDEVDSAVDTINRLAEATSFGQSKLLNGNLDFLIDSISPSASIDRVYVFQGPLAEVQKTINFRISNQAERAYVNIGAFANLAADEIWEIRGNQGSEVFSFSTGTSNAVVVSTINLAQEQTGVVAKTTGGNTYLASLEMGSDQFVQAVNIGSGAQFAGPLNDEGEDIEGSVMGIKAQGRGLWLRASGDHLDVDIEFVAPDVSAAVWLSSPAAATGSFKIQARGGAKLQIGPDPLSGQQVRIGLARMSSGSLGNNAAGRLSDITTGGQYDLFTDPDQAVKVADEAISFVAKVRGKVGALDKNTLQPMSDAMSVASENLTSALSDVKDTDYAKEAANFIRNQIMYAVGNNVYATANLMPAHVLALLS
jgi:flagellin